MAKPSDIKRSILRSTDEHKYAAGRHPETKERLYWEFVDNN